MPITLWERLINVLAEPITMWEGLINVLAEPITLWEELISVPITLWEGLINVLAEANNNVGGADHNAGGADGGVVVTQVEINVELTAEEWRRRHDKIKEHNNKLKATVER